MDSVTWLEDGAEIKDDSPDFVQAQSLLNATSATYRHTLSSGHASTLLGIFTCAVADVAGNIVRRTLELNGTIFSLFIISALV